MSKILIRQAANGEWYWQVRAANGRNLSDSGETYKTKNGAIRGFHTNRKTMAHAFLNNNFEVVPLSR